MRMEFRYQRGDLVEDIGLGGLPYRVERRLRDEDTEIGLYQLKRVDSNMELFRNSKLVDDLTRFRRYHPASHESME